MRRRSHNGKEFRKELLLKFEARVTASTSLAKKARRWKPKKPVAAKPGGNSPLLLKLPAAPKSGIRPMEPGNAMTARRSSPRSGRNLSALFQR